MTTLARRAGLRYLWQHPGQLTLAILGIALGVAVVVAVDLANGSAERAFLLSSQGVAGPATHQVVGGPEGLDETLYTRLRVREGLRDATPVLEVWVGVGAETLKLLGTDPLSGGPLRAGQGRYAELPLVRLLTEPGAVVMTGATARRLALQPGAAFEVRVSGHARALRLVGLLPEDPALPGVLDGLILADLATAQELSGQLGRLSRIDLALATGAAGQALQRRVAGLLPPDAALMPAGARGRAMDQMTRAFRTNLSAMSLLALMVGLFLIHNTMTFAVLQRRRLHATLRLLGVTRGRVLTLVLGEALVLGTVGTCLGLLAGAALGQGLVQLVSRTINDLYFAVAVREFLIDPVTLVKGVLLGLLATLAAALLPALEASLTPPQSVLGRSILESRIRGGAPRLALLGVALAGLSGLLLEVSDRHLAGAFTGVFLMILGLTLTVPLAVALLVRLGTPLAAGLFGIMGRVALRGIEASLSRTGIAIAALMLALSATVGVGVMIASFRTTVAVWLESTLRADLYISTPGLSAGPGRAPMDPRVAEIVAGLPGVAGVSSGHSVNIQSDQGLTQVFTVRPAPGQPPRFRLKAGDPNRVWRAFQDTEAVLVSEPYAYHNQVRVGDRITLRTDRGPHGFPVAGVYYDYNTGPGRVLLHRDLFDRFWNDRGVDALGVYLAPGTDTRTAMNAIGRALPPDAGVILRANREIREASLEVFDRTFTITRVLRLLVILVAFVGTVSALMALQMERAREWAILRATGFTPGQIRAMVTLQAGAMGLMAGLLALPAGLVLAHLLIQVINRRSFGWSMQVLVPGDVLLQSLALAVTAALLAGLYPGWHAARTPPAAALRSE